MYIRTKLFWNRYEKNANGKFLNRIITYIICTKQMRESTRRNLMWRKLITNFLMEDNSDSGVCYAYDIYKV
jgi:hypothetical protein